MTTTLDRYDFIEESNSIELGYEALMGDLKAVECVDSTIARLKIHDSVNYGMESFYRQFSLEEESTGAVNGSSAEAPEQTSSSVDESEKKNDAAKKNWFKRALERIKAFFKRIGELIVTGWRKFIGLFKKKVADNTIKNAAEKAGTNEDPVANKIENAVGNSADEIEKNIKNESSGAYGKVKGFYLARKYVMGANGENVFQFLEDGLRYATDSYQGVEKWLGNVKSQYDYSKYSKQTSSDNTEWGKLGESLNKADSVAKSFNKMTASMKHISAANGPAQIERAMKGFNDAKYEFFNEFESFRKDSSMAKGGSNNDFGATIHKEFASINQAFQKDVNSQANNIIKEISDTIAREKNSSKSERTANYGNVIKVLNRFESYSKRFEAAMKVSNAVIDKIKNDNSVNQYVVKYFTARSSLFNGYLNFGNFFINVINEFIRALSTSISSIPTDKSIEYDKKVAKLNEKRKAAGKDEIGESVVTKRKQQLGI